MNEHASLQQIKKPVKQPSSTVKASLQEELVEVARQAVANYVELLVKSKKQELQEQLDKENEILTILHEIKEEVTKGNMNLDLERDVLTDMKKELTR